MLIVGALRRVVPLDLRLGLARRVERVDLRHQEGLFGKIGVRLLYGIDGQQGMLHLEAVLELPRS